VVIIAICLNIIFNNIDKIEAASGYLIIRHWYTYNRRILTFCLFRDVAIPKDGYFLRGGRNKNVQGFGSEHNQNVEYLFIKMYQEFPNLLAYEVSNSLVKSIEYKHFEKLCKLEEIFILRSRISTISADAFNDLINLKLLSLEYNLLKSVDRYTFDSLKNLRILNLAMNQIKTVDKNAFDNLKELQFIKLSNNTIETFSKYTFLENEKLQYIWLDGNKIKYLTHSSFRYLDNLKSVNLKSNPEIDEFYANRRLQYSKNRSNGIYRRIHTSSSDLSDDD
jgi:Leucine-rich repeat (LRR) protein